jgi:hypothetical protein
MPPDKFSMPLCLARAWDLPSEIKGDIARYDEGKCVRVLQKERLCESFTKWHQGFSPKEHREMMDREEWRKWQASQNWKLVIVAGVFALLGAAITALATWVARS